MRHDTLSDEANAILRECRVVGVFNDMTAGGAEQMLLIAALAVDDDGALPQADATLIERVSHEAWPYVAAQLEYGLRQAAIDDRARKRWDIAIKAACRTVGREYPPPPDELDLIVPF